MKGEDLEQATLIQWCNLQSCKYSELKMIFAIPNGGYRNKEEAKQLNGAAWNSSKNLDKPVVKVKVITRSQFFKEEVTQSKEYKEYYLEKDSVYTGFNEFTGYKFFKYTLIRLN